MWIHRRGFLGSVAGAFAGMVGGWARAEAGWPSDPFLEGNYAPVGLEQTIGALEILGTLPTGLRGIYVRNGPNPRFPPIGRYHWFDGDGMVHAVRIGDGAASYRNRFVHTRGFDAEAKAGKALWAGMREPPFRSSPPKGMGRRKNVANTALVRHHGKLLALWEGGAPYELTASKLETVGPYLFGGALDHALCAHPKIDPVDGGLYGFGTKIRPQGPYLFYCAFDRAGRRTATRPVELPRPVMMHDFAITERYAVVLDLPYTFSFARLMTGRPPFAFEPKLGARFGVLRRDGGGDVRWFADDACWVFHTVGAFERGDEIVLLGCRYDAFPGALGFGGGEGSNEARLCEWRLDLKRGTTRRRFLSDVPVEMPRIDERRTGRSFRYAYFMAGDQRSVVRYDREKGRMQRHSFADGGLGEEVSFAPDPDRGGEGLGWLLGYVYQPATRRSELVVIDAARFDGPPVARIRLPCRVPFGLHGLWMPS